MRTFNYSKDADYRHSPMWTTVKKAIYLFIYFYTGPILIAVFITEMVFQFKHIIIIIVWNKGYGKTTAEKWL